jgi:outer membrane receptor protein involved in Fe transport
LEANLSNRFRSGKFFSIISANYGRTDGHRKNSEFEQTAGFVKLGYDFNKQWTLSGNTDITYFESSNPGEVTNPYLDNDMMITRGMAAISLTNTYEKTSGALRMYYNWGHHHIDDGYHPGATSPTYYYIHDDQMGGFSLYQSVSLLPGNHITMGLDYQNFGGHAYDKAKKDGARTELAKKNINEIAGYVQVSQELLSWMTFDGGIRLDHHSLSGNEWIPQGGFSFHFDDNSTGRVMISKGFRNATIRELYMFRPANANLKPEKLMNYELSYQKHLLDNKLYLGANVYYLKADNMIQTTMVNGKPLNANTGETENSGFEIEFKYQANTHFTLNGNYSFLHMSHPQLAAPEHKCFVEGSWKPTKLLQINTGIQYIAGLYTATGTKKKKENYWLWNTTVNINIQKGLHLFVRGENLLAQKYETVSGFPMPRATIMSGIDWTF